MLPATRGGYWRCVDHFSVAVAAPTDGRGRPLRSRSSASPKLYIPRTGRDVARILEMVLHIEDSLQAWKKNDPGILEMILG